MAVLSALPYPLYVDDRAHAGACANFGPSIPVIRVCNGDPGSGAEARTAYAYTANTLHFVSTYVVTRPGRSFGFEYTVICHELGHAFGAGPPVGERLVHATRAHVGEDDRKGYNGVDARDLIGLYYSHFPG